MRSDNFDPLDALVRDALTADRATAQRLARQAVTAPNRVRRPFAPALVGFTAIVAVAVGLTRYATSEPPIVIRGEGDTIVVESGPRLNRHIETFRNDPPRGGVVVIREGANR